MPRHDLTKPRVSYVNVFFWVYQFFFILSTEVSGLNHTRGARLPSLQRYQASQQVGSHVLGAGATAVIKFPAKSSIHRCDENPGAHYRLSSQSPGQPLLREARSTNASIFPTPSAASALLEARQVRRLSDLEVRRSSKQLGKPAAKNHTSNLDESITHHLPGMTVFHHTVSPLVLLGLAAGVAGSIGVAVAVYNRVYASCDLADATTDAKTWKSLLSLLGAWLTDPETRCLACGSAILVFALWVAREAVWAFVLTANRAEVTNILTNVHQTKDTDGVYRALVVMVIAEVFVGLPLFHVIDPLVSWYARLSLRNFITEKMLKAYLNGGGQAFYWLKMAESQSAIDNPDQRISDDSSAIADLIYGLYSSVLSSVLGCAMWTAVIVSLAPRMAVAICFACAAFRISLATYGFGHSLVVAQRDVLQTGAEVRYGLTRIRDSAEEIALAGGDKREHVRVVGLYSRHIGAIWHSVAVHLRYGVSLNVISYFPEVLLWLCLLPSISAGDLGFGDAIRVHQGMEQVSKVVGFVVDNFEGVANLKANADRLNQLLEACKDVNSSADAAPVIHVEDATVKACNSKLPEKLPVSREESDISHANRISMCEAPPGMALVLEDVVVSLPADCSTDSAKLVGGVSLVCSKGEGLLIMGPSGSGKSSLLRAISGLWQAGSGSVARPSATTEESLKILPSRSYLPIGTLQDLVCYPGASSVCNLDLSNALRRARLEYLIERVGMSRDQDWKTVLSPGEQQRVAFARLFLQIKDAPPNSMLVLLDEATGQLDADTERALYTELRSELSAGGGLMGFLSIGHRLSLLAFHESILRITESSFEDDQAALLDSDSLNIGSSNSEDSPSDTSYSLAEQTGLEEHPKGNWLLPTGKHVPWRHIKLPPPAP